MFQKAAPSVDISINAACTVPAPADNITIAVKLANPILANRSMVISILVTWLVGCICGSGSLFSQYEMCRTNCWPRVSRSRFLLKVIRGGQLYTLVSMYLCELDFHVMIYKQAHIACAWRIVSPAFPEDCFLSKSLRAFLHLGTDHFRRPERQVFPAPPGTRPRPGTGLR